MNIINKIKNIFIKEKCKYCNSIYFITKSNKCTYKDCYNCNIQYAFINKELINIFYKVYYVNKLYYITIFLDDNKTVIKNYKLYLDREGTATYEINSNKELSLIEAKLLLDNLVFS